MYELEAAKITKYKPAVTNAEQKINLLVHLVNKHEVSVIQLMTKGLGKAHMDGD